MRKMKTIKSVSKRFKETSQKKFKRKHANLRHILTKKTKKHKRSLRKLSFLNKKNLIFIKNCLPYSKV